MEMKTQVEEITRSLKMMDIEPLQIQEPIRWEPEYKFHILRLIMFGAFYPNYFVKSSSHELEKLAHKTLCGRDPKNTVYLHGFDKDQAQFGELYVDQVKRLFRAATEDEDRISLTFSGAHIFVEFDRPLQDQDRSMASYRASRQDRNVTGDISSQVGAKS
jgi:ATP-dependent RNA helicase TDRD9